MDLEVSGSTPPASPNPELISVLENAQKFALRLKNERVQDVHLLWAALGSSAVSPEDNEFASVGVRKNSVFLAMKTVFGSGTKKDRKAASFTSEARDAYNTTIEQAAEAGRLAEPADLLRNILQNPSIGTRMVLNTIVQEHLRINGAPGRAKARAEVWAYELVMPNISLLKPRATTVDLPQPTDAFLRRVSMQMA